ncbi:MAG: DnaD domain protein [Bacilli bacterium]|nr:DnaD domain protein [Bacilli bacterium]
MISEAIDFRFLLLENYKKLKIREDELAVIFMIDHLIGQGNPFITADLLSLKMTLDVKTIDKCLAGLLTRGFIEYVTQGKKTVTSLNPLKEKLYREFQMSSSFEENSSKSDKVKEMINNIYSEFEKLLSRPLSQVEFSRIREWVSYGYSDETIINALKEAISKGKKSLRSVDKILVSWSEREDIEKEGHTSLNQNWDKNLEETIKIAKTPWLDQLDDDDK